MTTKQMVIFTNTLNIRLNVILLQINFYITDTRKVQKFV